jgi:hypothetical protein
VAALLAVVPLTARLALAMAVAPVAVAVAFLTLLIGHRISGRREELAEAAEAPEAVLVAVLGAASGEVLVAAAGERPVAWQVSQVSVVLVVAELEVNAWL